jgi:hypothetical protein
MSYFACQIGSTAPCTVFVNLQMPTTRRGFQGSLQGESYKGLQSWQDSRSRTCIYPHAFHLSLAGRLAFESEMAHLEALVW